MKNFCFEKFESIIVYSGNSFILEFRGFFLYTLTLLKVGDYTKKNRKMYCTCTFSDFGFNVLRSLLIHNLS